jgi:hypothetical protein
MRILEEPTFGALSQADPGYCPLQIKLWSKKARLHPLETQVWGYDIPRDPEPPHAASIAPEQFRPVPC